MLLVLLALGAFSLAVNPAHGQQKSLSDRPANSAYRQGQAEFYRAFYLHHEQGDLKKAAAAYQKALRLGINQETRETIKDNLQSLQEDLNAANFARLMPADSLGYLEISDPGQHLEEVARMMGVTGRTFEPNHKPTRINLDGIAISSDFQVSPALLREIKKFRGLAVSISNISPQDGKPIGVAVIHPGDSDLLTGLVETGIQLVPATESVRGFPTFQIEREVWIVKTKRLIFASTSKTEIENSISRLQNSNNANNANNADSLASHDAFQEAKKRHQDSVLFAFADPKVALKKLGPMLGREAAIAQLVLDVPHMKYVAASIASTDRGVRSNINVAMEEGHNSLAYGMFRTVPLSQKAVSNIPSGAAVVAGLGLNPKLALAAESMGDSHITALDIGRELFANIEEVGFFVLPELANQQAGIPEFGMVFVCNDVEKSQALWNHLLSLPEKMQLGDGPTSQDVSISGVKTRKYSFRETEIPDFAICQIGKQSMLVGTEGALKAAIASSRSKDSFSNSDSARLIWGPKSSNAPAKMVCVNVAQAIKLASQLENGGDSQMIQMIGDTLNDLTITLVSNEQPTDFEFRFEAANLPQFEALLKTASRIENSRSEAVAQEYRGWEHERAVRGAKVVRDARREQRRAPARRVRGNARELRASDAFQED